MLNKRRLKFKSYVQITGPWVDIRERRLLKKHYWKVGAYLRWALIWEWAQNRAFMVYIIYRKKVAHNSNSKLPFPAVKLGFNLSLNNKSVTRIQHSQRWKVILSLSNVMDNFKLLKSMLKFQFFQNIYIWIKCLHKPFIFIYSTFPVNFQITF